MLHRESASSPPTNPAEILSELRQRQTEHPLWEHQLLVGCREGTLTVEDFRYLFSQYHLYSISFTRFLAALMMRCESDLFRARLSQNLWEEGGGCEPSNRHCELFRLFLRDAMGVEDPSTLIYESYTRHFVAQYLEACLDDDIVASTAFLALGTEGIVPGLYTLFISGLTQAGVADDHLSFFKLHVNADDAHADTLAQMLCSYAHRPGWVDLCHRGLERALGLRQRFFDDVVAGLQRRRIGGILERIAARKSLAPERSADSVLVVPSGGAGVPLYENEIERLGIRFAVERLPVAGEVLDPRIVRIPAGKRNERHRHAHETVFYIVSGSGTIDIGDQRIAVRSGDVAFVPRWCLHQAHAADDGPMVILAVTDYGLTRRAYVGNYEKTARPYGSGSVH
jgi:quercetin dioxygenase-like cupin family protein/pyrroloquinoline quinone (PQQ) biosynthesis protein C